MSGPVVRVTLKDLLDPTSVHCSAKDKMNAQVYKSAQYTKLFNFLKNRVGNKGTILDGALVTTKACTRQILLRLHREATEVSRHCSHNLLTNLDCVYWFVFFFAHFSFSFLLAC